MSNRVRVWDLPVRVFHWLLAGSFVTAYLVAESDRLRSVHVILGYTATGLILFRIVWGFVGSHNARFSSFLFSPGAAIQYLSSLTKEPQHFVGHNPAGSYVIYAILLVGLATGVTGYMTLEKIGGAELEDIHEACANVWLGLVVLHVAGVIATSWLHRESLVKAMITGYKAGAQRSSNAFSAQEPGVPHGRAVGIAVAVGVGAFWVWSLLTGYSPGAMQHGVEHGVREELDERAQTAQSSELTREGRKPSRVREFIKGTPSDYD